jgi:ribosomal protein S18 acetylase RimI-like enzyme
MDAVSRVVLREAGADDLLAALAVLHAAFEEYRAWLDPPSGVHRETVESLRAYLARGHLTLALLQSEIVGCVLYHAEEDHVYFGRLSVLPAARNRGIARTLVDHVEARTCDLGLPRVRLSVRIALPHNRAYYERIGYRFVEARTHTGYSEPTYVVLEKALRLWRV